MCHQFEFARIPLPGRLIQVGEERVSSVEERPLRRAHTPHHKTQSTGPGEAFTCLQSHQHARSQFFLQPQLLQLPTTTTNKPFCFMHRLRHKANNSGVEWHPKELVLAEWNNAKFCGRMRCDAIYKDTIF